MRFGIDARMYSSSFTGIGRYTYELIQHLLEIDQTNEYVLFFNSPEYQKYVCFSERVKKRLVDARHYSWEEQTKFLRILQQENLDLMHFTHFNAPLFYKKPCLVTIHDLTLSFFPGKKMTNPIHRLGYRLDISSILKKAKQVITVSHHTKRDLQTLFKVPSPKIAVIYEAVAANFKKIEDATAINSLKQQWQLDKPFILYTGVWRDHKNVVGLIKAWHKLIRAGKFDGYLVITGREDPFYPEVKFTVRSLNLAKQVKFTGLVTDEELVLLYNSAAVFVLPSFYEGFGLSPLEAFACGVPVAASGTSCLPEICGKRNALFFDPYNIDDIADKIFQLLSNEELRNQLIHRGYRRLQEFSWAKTAEETLKVYKQATG